MLVAQNAHRQLLNHRHAYAAPSETAQNAGPTEVDNSARPSPRSTMHGSGWASSTDTYPSSYNIRHRYPYVS